MKIGLTAPLISIVALLGGCATTNTQQEIDQYALVWLGSKLCGESGMLDRDTAAKGMAWAMSNIYRSESSRVQAKIQEYAARNERPNQEQCNSLGLHIAAQTASAPSKATSAPSNAPRYTTCNKAFNQTFCTSY